MHAWYFAADGRAAQYAMDGCGDLPCSLDPNVTAEGATSGLRSARCPLLESVRECHARCRLNRRRRRIRLGLNPAHVGHNVCQVEPDGALRDDASAPVAVDGDGDSDGGDEGSDGAEPASPPHVVASEAESNANLVSDMEDDRAVGQMNQVDELQRELGGGGGRGRQRRRRWRQRRRHRQSLQEARNHERQ